MPRNQNIKLRRGTSSEWSSANPVLDDGELGYDKTNGIIRIGDSSSNWSALPEALMSVNPTMATDSKKSNYLVVISPVVNFKTVAETNIFTIPSGYIFFIEEMEVVTTDITSAGAAPYVRFGKTGNSSAFFATAQSTSNSTLVRHIISSPQSGQQGETTVTFGITTASTASAHEGVAIVKGFIRKA